jgi:hypothetical protein
VTNLERYGDADPVEFGGPVDLDPSASPPDSPRSYFRSSRES